MSSDLPTRPERPARPRRRRAPREAAPAAAPSGFWLISGVAQPTPVLVRLADVLPHATTVVTVGDRRSWFALAGAESEVVPTLGAGAPTGEQRLPFSRRILDCLALAAMTDGPTPFCRELRVYAGSELLLRWTGPAGGDLRLSARVPAPVVWTLASQGGAAHRWQHGAL